MALFVKGKEYMYCFIVEGQILAADCEELQAQGGACENCEYYNHFVWYNCAQ